MKTVLVAGVGWPTSNTEVRGKPSPEKTDANFEKWVKKNKDALVTGAALGMSIKEEIKSKAKTSSTRSTKTTSKPTSRT